MDGNDVSNPLDALSREAMVVDVSARARLRVVGEDARAFLHRLSTNHVKDLVAGEGRLNILPTDKGRLVDVVLHLDRGDAGLLLVGGMGRGDVLLAWLDRYLFTEKVELSDQSSVGSCVEVIGSAAPRLVEALVPGAAALDPWAFVERAGRVVARTFDAVDGDGNLVPGYCLIDLERPDVAAALGPDVVVATAEAASVVRIAAGVPDIGGEIQDRYNPLDLGLHDAIHWNKGCYIGQEVIARLDTYQKQKKRLVSLHVKASELVRISAGAEILVGDVVIGEVTSVAPWAWRERPNLLAICKLKEGLTEVDVRLGEGTVRAALSMPATAQTPHG